MWQEFHNQIDTVGLISEQLLHDLFTQDSNLEVDFLQRKSVQLEPSDTLVMTDKTESTAIVKVRRGQQFFRQVVLNAYGVRCCISGINVSRLLRC